MESFLKDSPRGFQAIVSKVASSHAESRPVAEEKVTIEKCEPALWVTRRKEGHSKVLL
jgi:hypothetical protein